MLFDLIARKQRWLPVLSKIDQKRRENLRKKLSLHMDNTLLRVCKADASKKELRKMKFHKPHWPPVIFAKESEKRRRCRKSLEEDGSQATPSTSKQWPPKMKTCQGSERWNEDHATAIATHKSPSLLRCYGDLLQHSFNKLSQHLLGLEQDYSKPKVCTVSSGKLIGMECLCSQQCWEFREKFVQAYMPQNESETTWWR
ncbi:hypothetical protein Q8A67_010366 [Cirrhinus molitorella]|uniref:Uncharacterized protein n=1 Tax=Cirrhinus molitorella TaxID=172907 RepID=A0AA88PTM0_9TELE|nr:hypothetical protein Q8A67_010366 [Cirrhinus molitorella]